MRPCILMLARNCTQSRPISSLSILTVTSAINHRIVFSFQFSAIRNNQSEADWFTCHVFSLTTVKTDSIEGPLIVCTI